MSESGESFLSLPPGVYHETLTINSPLLPGTCHSTELKLLPLSVGCLHLEAVRLVDVNTNETTDIRDLPDIIVTERQVLN